MDDIIDVKDLCFSYPGRKKILDGISFSVERGASVAVLGSNGSGKSTLLKLLSSLLLPTSGKILVDGFDSSDRKGSSHIRKSTAFVFQNPDACFVRDRVICDAEFTPLSEGYSDEDARAMAMESLERHGLAEMGNRKVNTLSGGEKERAIMASLSSSPKDIYYFDEALTYLDEVSRRELLRSISALRDEGKTVLFVTQSSEDALLFDRTLLLARGKVLAYGKSREILEDTELLKKAGIRLTRASSLALELQGLGVKFKTFPISKEDYIC